MQPIPQERRPAQGTGGSTPPRPGFATLDEVLERWVRELEGAGVPPPERARPAAAATSDERPGAPARRPAPVPAESAPGRRPLAEQVVLLPDAPGERVALSARGSRVVHPGTVAVRGPLAPPREAYLALGLTDAEADALRFVAAWFGAPFDAVNARRRARHPLALGCWHLSGDAVTECLVRWKRRAPEAFGRRVAALGIDVAAPEGQPPRLLARIAGGEGVLGEDAADAIATEPALVAALARAGRDRDGQLAQLEVIAERSLRPALATPVPGGAEPLGARLTTSRGVALAVHADLVFGAAGPAHLAASLAGEPPASPGALDAVVTRWLGALERAGCAAEREQVLRIVTSPELEGPQPRE